MNLQDNTNGFHNNGITLADALLSLQINKANEIGFVLRPGDVLCAKATTREPT
ncbi:hypothetical protein SAMN06295926_107135 [Lysinibacillus sp. AC-3]|nr:hypothetical protein SAMN06295926_107135 [Lysinibacillus sp. AC-3]